MLLVNLLKLLIADYKASQHISNHWCTKWFYIRFVEYQQLFGTTEWFRGELKNSLFTSAYDWVVSKATGA